MIKMLKYLINHLESQEKQLIRWLVFLCVLAPVIDLFSVSMIVPILNQAIGHEVSRELILKVILLGTVFLLKGVFELVRSKVSNNFLHNCTQRWALKIYDLFCKEDLLDHNQKTNVQAIAGVMQDTQICAQLITVFLDLCVSLLTLTGYFLVIIFVAGWIGVVSCVLIVLAMSVLILGNYIRIERYGEKKRKIEIKANSLVSTAYGAYKELKIDSRRENMLSKFDETSWALAKIQKDYAFIKTVLGILLVNVIQAFMFYFLAVLLAAEVDMSSIMAEIVVYVTLLIRMIPVANTAVSGLSSIQYGKKYYEVLRKNLDSYELIKQNEKRKAQLREKELEFTEGIRVENLTFGYTDENILFENASIEVPVGSATAITGLSGTGKTTFLDIILGLLTPTNGHIWYDDYDIVDGRDSLGACKVDLGKTVSYIPQTVYLYGETIRNNVVFMSEDEEGDEARIIECLKGARVWDDIQKMPKGLDSVVGLDGTMISGGQRQRVALARALYKDFKLLIMDEATAALDMDTEKAVIDSIRQMKQGRTLLMVTHHQSLAAECDHIYKIEGKKLVKLR